MSAFLQWAIAAGLGAILLEVVRSVLQRKKMGADAAKVNVDTAISLLGPLQKEIQRLQGEVTVAREETAAAKREGAECRRELTMTKAELSEARREVRHLRDRVREAEKGFE